MIAGEEVSVDFIEFNRQQLELELQAYLAKQAVLPKEDAVINTHVPKQSSFVRNDLINTIETRQCKKTDKGGNLLGHSNYVAKIVAAYGKVKIYSACPECAALEKKREDEKHQREAAAALVLKQRQLDERFENSKIPPLYENCSFDNYQIYEETDENLKQVMAQRKALGKFKDFADKVYKNPREAKFLVGYGCTGTGKNHLAMAVVNHAIGKRTCLYILASDMIGLIRETWGSKEKTSAIINELVNVDLLILDELGEGSRGSENEQSLLFRVLSKRMDWLKPTILLTNLPIAKDDDERLLDPDFKHFRWYVGERIYDRLKKEAALPVHFNWQSYRGRAK